jgi:O-antigen/teichoic acid export membrane protein
VEGDRGSVATDVPGGDHETGASGTGALVSDERAGSDAAPAGGDSRSETDERERHALNRKVAGGVAWTASAKIFSQVIAWSCTIFVARMLQPSDYGLIGMSGVFIGFVQLVTELGLANTVVYLRTISRHQIEQLNGLALGLAIAAMGLTVAVAPWAARFYGEPRLTSVMMVMSATFLVIGLRAVPYGLMERAMDFRYLAMLEIGQGAITGPLTLGLAWYGFGYWSLIVGQLVGTSVGTLVMVMRDPRGFAIPRPSELGEALRLSYHLVVARVAWYAYSNSDYVVVGRRLGAGPLGAYSLAFTIASAPVDKITALLVRVTRPAFATVQDHRSEVKRVFLSASAALAFVTIPASVGLAVLAPDLVPLLFGDKWNDAIIPLMLLALCTPIRSLAPLLPQILNATGDSRFSMRLNLVAVVVLPLSFVVASTGGLPAVAGVWVLIYPLLILPAAVRVSHRIELTAREYLTATGPPIIGAALMGGAVLALRVSLPEAWSAALRLSLLVFAGIAIFSLVMLTVFRIRTTEYLSALRKLRGR